MAKTREPDKLAQDAVEAKKAGVSYGQWMAKMHPVTPPKTPRFPPVKCFNCGKLIYPTNRLERKFCNEYCNSQYQSRKARAEKTDGPLDQG